MKEKFSSLLHTSPSDGNPKFLPDESEEVEEVKKEEYNIQHFKKGTPLRQKLLKKILEKKNLNPYTYLEIEATLNQSNSKLLQIRPMKKLKEKILINFRIESGIGEVNIAVYCTSADNRKILLFSGPVRNEWDGQTDFSARRKVKKKSRVRLVTINASKTNDNELTLSHTISRSIKQR